MCSGVDRNSSFFAGCRGLHRVHGRRKARILAGLIPFNRETGSQHNEIDGDVSLRFGLVWMISSWLVCWQKGAVSASHVELEYSHAA